MNIELASKKSTLDDEELMELLSTQFQIAFAFRSANVSGSEWINHLERLIKHDSLIAGHMVAMECLLLMKQTKD